MKWKKSTQFSSDLASWDKGIKLIALKAIQGRSTQAKMSCRLSVFRSKIFEINITSYVDINL